MTIKNTHWEAFLTLCLKCKNTAELEQLFELFLTIEEQETLSSRYIIIQALLEDRLTQREIAETYHVSIAQITRGSNALKRIPSHYKNILKTHITSSP